jgi:hypothetical protein
MITKTHLIGFLANVGIAAVVLALGAAIIFGCFWVVTHMSPGTFFLTSLGLGALWLCIAGAEETGKAIEKQRTKS